MRRFGLAAVTLVMAGCNTPTLRLDLPAATPTSVDELAAAIAADAQRSDHESDSKIREALAADADRDAAACLARAPQSVACLYYHGIALGLMARAHPTRAGELLKSMLEALNAAAAVDAGYDDAGPLRVQALVLIKAPGWPLGPGDPDAGVAAARRAVSLAPQYPPNVLAFAEALAKTGDSPGAQEHYRRARELAQSLPASSDRDAWLGQADQALKRP
jgi:tetratricopeptide (TPR) repeat protein